MGNCPTCAGTGSVPQHVADALNQQGSHQQGGSSHVGKTCHCDGPAHTWDPSWCPKGGPR